MTYALPRSTPSEQGFDAQGILAFLRAMQDENLELHSFMLLRHGHVVAEGWYDPYGPDRPHSLFSLSKSFTSTAVGFAVAEGKLSVDDFVLSFFPEYITPEIKDNMSEMRVKHLLSMSTGHKNDTTGLLRAEPEGDWVKAFLTAPIEYEPGTHFLYNSGATYMLSAIVQRVTGQTLVQYLTPRLFAPLHIENATWETCPRGVNAGGWGLSIKTEDIAKFGQLYLDDGIWLGEQLLPVGWVKEATSFHVSNGDDANSDWAQGYGYQFWRCRHNVYRGDGAFGQYCVVMPEQDAVVAITSAVGNMQAVLNGIWKHILPAMLSSAKDDELAQVLAGLNIDAPTGTTQPMLATVISGKRFELEPCGAIRSVTFAFNEEKCVATVDYEAGSQCITIGHGRWVEGETTMFANVTRRVVSAGAWRDDHTYVAIVRLVETPFYYTIKCMFDDQTVLIDNRVNVGFGDREPATFKGRLA